MNLTRTVHNTARNPRNPGIRQNLEHNRNALPTRAPNIPRKSNHAAPLRSPQNKLRHELLNNRPRNTGRNVSHRIHISRKGNGDAIKDPAKSGLLYSARSDACCDFFEDLLGK